MLLLIPAAAALLFVLGVLGVRLLRTTGLEHIEEGIRTSREEERRRGFGAALDAFGGAFLGSAMRLYGPDRLRRLEETIRRAGRPEGLTLSVYLRRQAAFVVLGVIGLVVMVMAGLPVLGVAVLMLFAGWMRLWLVQAGSKRRQQIESELPDFLDVLGVTVSAGLAFRAAIERVCQFHDGPLAEEMTTTLREMGVGVSRRQAFVSLRERTGSDGVSSFVTALLQAEELGVPLAQALEAIASDARQERAQHVRQQAAKAAPKVSLVVTMTIVPASVLLIGSAVILANVGELGWSF